MTKKMIVVVLSREYDLGTLPAAESRTVIHCGYAVETLTLSELRLRMEDVLENVGAVLSLQDKVYIVMKATPREFAVAWMLTSALGMLSIEPEIWINEKLGMYIGIQEFLATGKNWANEMLEKWRLASASELFAQENKESEPAKE